MTSLDEETIEIELEFASPLLVSAGDQPDILIV